MSYTDAGDTIIAKAKYFMTSSKERAKKVARLSGRKVENPSPGVYVVRDEPETDRP